MVTYDIRGTVVGETALAIKAPCLVATTGSNIMLSGVQVIDRVTVGNNSERVLVKDQTDQTTNAIYIAQTGSWLLAADFGNNNNVIYGTQVMVASGATNQGLTYICTCSDNPIVIGTSEITFEAEQLFDAQAQLATSSTDIAISSGVSLTFQIQTGKPFAVGQWVSISSRGTPSDYMAALITSYVGTTLMVYSALASGSGTHSDWNIAVSGAPGAVGMPGSYFFDTVSEAEAANIPAGINWLLIAGYSTVGTAGGIWKRLGGSSTDPRAFQSADGAWWGEWYGLNPRVSFFDFLPNNLIPSVQSGTNGTDLGTYWNNFATFLAATTPPPKAYIPNCVVLTSQTPNFAVENLEIETDGDVLIKYTGSSGNGGFYLNGASGANNVSGYVNNMKVGRLRVEANGSAIGVFVNQVDHSDLSFDVIGATTDAVYVVNCTCTTFRRPTCSSNEGALTTVPTNGLVLTGTGGGYSAYCTIEQPVMEGVGTGILMDYSLGNIVIGGTAEGCSSTGVQLTANAQVNRFFGTNFETNTSYDIHCTGFKNEFVGVSTLAGGITFDGAGYNNNVWGGQHQSVTFNSTANSNLLCGIAYNRQATSGAITDNTTAQNNAFRRCLNLGTGVWHDGLPIVSNPSVGASPFTYQNTTGNNQLVIIAGGTVSAIAYKRGSNPQTSVGFVAGTVYLAAGDELIVNYSVAPTTFQVIPV